MGSRPDTLNTALEAARAGMHVLPVNPVTKAPLTQRGHHDATTDEQTIRQWFQDPNVGLGISLEPSGLVALDVDVKDGKPGMESLAKIDGQLPDTLSARTRSGGLHAIFRRTDDNQRRRICDNRKSKPWMPGIDLLGKGYIIIAPTEGYEWLRVIDPAPLPPVLAEAFAARGQKARQPHANGANSIRAIQAHKAPAPQHVLDHARARLARHGPAIEGQAGDAHTLVACAIVVNDYNLPYEQAWPLLLEWNKTCNPPWDEGDLDTKLGNAERYSSGQTGIARAEANVAAILSELTPTPPPAPSDDALTAAVEGARRKGARSSKQQQIELAQYLQRVQKHDFAAAAEPVLHAAAVLSVAPKGTTDEQAADLLMGCLGSRDAALEAIQEARQYDSTANLDLDTFVLRGDGSISTTAQHNVDAAMAQLGVSVKYDEFSDTGFVVRDDSISEIDDDSTRRLRFEIDTTFGFLCPKDFFWDVVVDRAKQNTYHSVCDYLDGLQWDGTPRISHWLTTYSGAPDTPYTRAVGRLVLVAACRRVRRPGCKFDEMLILESPQGKYKSEALKALAVRPEWFSDDLPLNADTQKAIERMQGHWLIEAGELKGMRKGEVSDLKAFLSRTRDVARLAYDRFPSKKPRQCIIIGTTNDATYLKDTTGNRRFWPVSVNSFNVPALQRDRDQLWAEASAAEASGESIRLDPSLYDAAAEVQAARQVDNPMVDLLCACGLDELEGVMTQADFWLAIGIKGVDARPQQVEQRDAALAQLGWEKCRSRIRFPSGRAVAYKRGSARTKWALQYQGPGKWGLVRVE